MRFNPFTKSPAPEPEPAPSTRRSRKRSNSPISPTASADLASRIEQNRAREHAKRLKAQACLLEGWDDEGVCIMLGLGTSASEKLLASESRTLWPEFIRERDGFASNREAMAAFREWITAGTRAARGASAAPSRSDSPLAAPAALDPVGELLAIANLV